MKMTNQYIRKFIAAATAAIMAGSLLSACGSKEDAESSNVSVTTTTTAMSVTLAQSIKHR